MARALIVQHVAAEGPARVAEHLAAAGIDVVVHRSDLDAAIPALDGFDAVVVMGSPQDAYRDEGFPTRRAELALLADALPAEVPVLGICLGAQLLAIAGGGSAYRGEHGPEVGWAPVTWSPEAATDRLLGPVAHLGGAEVLHWHGDTFSLPPGAVRLASSDRYENQAFRLGDVAWGLQFHCEVDEAAVRRFAETFAGDAAQAEGGVAGIVERAPACLAALEPVTAAVLGGFAEVVVENARTL